MHGVEYWNFDLRRRLEWCKNSNDLDKLFKDFKYKLGFILEI